MQKARLSLLQSGLAALWPAAAIAREQMCVRQPAEQSVRSLGRRRHR